MATLTITNGTTSPTGVSDNTGFGVNLLVPPSSTGSVTLLPYQMAYMLAQLRQLATNSLITWTLTGDQDQSLQTVTTLPQPAIGYQGMLFLIPGGTGEADDICTCVKAQDGTYSWVSIIRS